MRKPVPFRLIIPRSIMESLDKLSVNHKERYVYIVNHLLLKSLSDKRYEKVGYVPLNKKKLQGILGCNVEPYIKLLEKNELIESDKKFIQRVKSYHYRIHPNHLYEPYSFVVSVESSLFQNKIAELMRERTNYCRLQPHLRAMQKEFMKLQYDYDKAVEWIEINATGQKRISYLISVDRINDNRFRYFKRNRTNNRLDTNLTNLKKELRQFIEGDYVQIDLKNSQPFLLSMLLMEIADIIEYFAENQIEINHNTMKDYINHRTSPLCCKGRVVDLVEYFGLQTFKQLLLIRKNRHFLFFTNLMKLNKWATEGNLYDEFSASYGEIPRDEMKTIMFKVLFSRNFEYKPEKEVFRRVFPVVNEMIAALKGYKKHERLAIYLQRMESRIFIDCIAKKLVENGIVPLTVHDSVIVPTARKDLALGLINSIFHAEFGVVPCFHVEPLAGQVETNDMGFRDTG